MTRNAADIGPRGRLVIAGGGTGGHLFPGIAVAEAFMARHSKNRVLFIGTDKPFEKRVLAAAGFDHAVVSAAGIKGLGLWRKCRAMAAVPRAMIQAAGIMAGFNPSAVLCVGGYSAGPVAAAARISGILVALHEQNRLPGITNRLVARFAGRIYLSFADTVLPGPERQVLTGNPVRRGFLEPAPEPSARVANRFYLLVVGGSQGAHGINRAMTAALGRLERPDALFLVHQTGATDLAEVTAAYAEAGIEGEVMAFIEDIPVHYRRADLVVCRAGATTVAELTAMGRPALFVPFPQAADNHQVVNAQALVAAGAADMIEEKDISGEILAERIDSFRRSPERLREMAAAAARLGLPDAAERIVDDMARHLFKDSPAGRGVPAAPLEGGPNGNGHD